MEEAEEAEAEEAAAVEAAAVVEAAEWCRWAHRAVR